MHIDWEQLWLRVAQQFRLGEMSIHGPSHWQRVEQNGLKIAKSSGANITVVRLFAVFHDSRRANESSDMGHGLRGARLAREMHGTLFTVSAEELLLLEEACASHTTGHHHMDPTIGTCWDADRLDLGRVGTIPDESFMSTEEGKRLARSLRH